MCPVPPQKACWGLAAALNPPGRLGTAKFQSPTAVPRDQSPSRATWGQLNQLARWGDGQARSSAWRAGHCSHSGLDSSGNPEHLISLCSMFFHLLSTSHLSKGTDKQCLQEASMSQGRKSWRISPTSLYHCDFLFIQLPAPTEDRA